MLTMLPESKPNRYDISWLNLLLFLVATVWVFQYSFSEKANTDFYTTNRNSTWKRWTNIYPVNAPLLIPIHLFYPFTVLFN